MPQNNSFNFAGVNKFTVSSSTSNGSYTTIQSAINAASTAGGGTVYILPGTYVTNLTIPGGVSLQGFTDLAQSSVIIVGNATITNPIGNVSIEKLTMSAISGTTLAISTNTSSTGVISINESTIANSSGAGTCISSASTVTGNPTISVVTANIQSSGIAISTNGTQSLSVGYSLVAGGAGAAFDITGATTVSSFWNNLQSTASNITTIRSTTSVVSISQSVGSSSLEVVNFAAAGTAGMTNSSFICSAVSGNWATGAGTLQYGVVSINGTAQSIASATTKIPVYSQPSRFLTAQSISANATLAVNTVYYVSSGSLSLALPVASAVGDVIQVSLTAGTAWTITQAAGQQIALGNVNTTLGATGTLASSSAGDSVTISCFTANTRWIVTQVTGNLQVV